MIVQAILITFIYATGIAIGCPEGIGWIPAGESCYLVSTDQMNWFQAQMYCAQRNGYLAEIESAEETELVNNLIPVDDNGIAVLIGLSDSAIEGQWIWQHSYQPMEYSNWAPNQPQPDWHGGEVDCAVIGHSDKRWDSVGCDWSAGVSGQPFHAFCEAANL